MSEIFVTKKNRKSYLLKISLISLKTKIFCHKKNSHSANKRLNYIHLVAIVYGLVNSSLMFKVKETNKFQELHKYFSGPLSNS